MKNILLPTDFSETSWNAIVYALKLLEDTPCTFYVLHVNALSYVATNELPPSQNKDVVEETYTEPAKKQLRSLLKRIATEFPVRPHHHFFSLTDYNFFVDSVRSHVVEKKIDLIVMGTKGASGLRKIIIGSNAADVIKKVQCPALVVPGDAKFDGLKEVAFPTDYLLTYGVDLLKPLYEIMEAHNSNLQVLHVTHKDDTLSIAQQNNRDLLKEYFIKFESEFHVLSNKNVEDAIESFVKRTDIKMVAMVAKNLNYFQRILFHNKIEEMTYHTHIPFLVMHDK